MLSLATLPAFQPLVLFTVLLILKMSAVAFVTSNERRKAKVVLNPEDVGVNPGSHAENARGREHVAGQTCAPERRREHSGLPGARVDLHIRRLFGHRGLGLLRRVLRRARAAHGLLSEGRSTVAHGRVHRRSAHGTRHHGPAARKHFLTRTAVLRKKCLVLRFVRQRRRPELLHRQERERR